MSVSMVRGPRLSLALNREVDAAVRRGGAAPVREMAARVAQAVDAPFDQYEMLVDAISSMCIRSGLVLEFSGRWSDRGARASDHFAMSRPAQVAQVG